MKLLAGFILGLIVCGLILLHLYYINSNKPDISSWAKTSCSDHRGVQAAASGSIQNEKYFIVLCVDGSSKLERITEIK